MVFHNVKKNSTNCGEFKHLPVPFFEKHGRVVVKEKLGRISVIIYVNDFESSAVLGLDFATSNIDTGVKDVYVHVHEPVVMVVNTVAIIFFSSPDKLTS